MKVVFNGGSDVREFAKTLRHFVKYEFLSEWILAGTLLRSSGPYLGCLVTAN